MRNILRLALCLVLVAAVWPAAASLITDEYAQAQSLIQAGRVNDALPHLQTIVVEGAKGHAVEWSVADLLAVAGAHRIMMGLTYLQALKNPELSPAQAQEAREWSDRALGLERVRVVGRGETIDLKSLLVPGKTNIVDFFSLYCGPCSQIGVFVDAMVERTPDVVLIRVDINRPGPDHKGIDWQSPLARQFSLQSIPAFQVYGPDGQLLAEGDAGQKKVMEMIKQAGLL